MSDMEREQSPSSSLYSMNEISEIFTGSCPSTNFIGNQSIITSQRLLSPTPSTHSEHIEVGDEGLQDRTDELPETMTDISDSSQRDFHESVPKLIDLLKDQKSKFFFVVGRTSRQARIVCCLVVDQN